ncbi:MAG: OsmC family protein [Bacteroidota bacterium]|nr:OsmC family protein [Bacteroidota bacterium]
MKKEHHYKSTITWTGNTGQGTIDAKSYSRNHTVSIKNKVDILASSDIPFRGDGTRHNPEDFLLSALSQCHMLWYLHICADNGITVVEYVDNAEGTMEENEGGGGQFKEVTLFPTVTITNADHIEQANALHAVANKKCFIANSCNFPVKHQANCIIKTF